MLFNIPVLISYGFKINYCHSCLLYYRGDHRRKDGASKLSRHHAQGQEIHSYTLNLKAIIKFYFLKTELNVKQYALKKNIYKFLLFMTVN